MTSTNTNMASIAKGIDNQLDFVSPANDKARVRVLRDFISREDMDQGPQQRQFLDKMDPNARAGLYVALTALEAAVT